MFKTNFFVPFLNQLFKNVLIGKTFKLFLNQRKHLLSCQSEIAQTRLRPMLPGDKLLKNTHIYNLLKPYIRNSKYMIPTRRGVPLRSNRPHKIPNNKIIIYLDKEITPRPVTRRVIVGHHYSRRSPKLWWNWPKGNQGLDQWKLHLLADLAR